MDKVVEAKLLKTPQDFTNLISLQELSTQMTILDFIKKNLHKYQMNYVKSFMKTPDEVLKYIPEKDHNQYFRNTRKNYDRDKPEKGMTLRKGLIEESRERSWSSQIPQITHFFVNIKDKKIEGGDIGGDLSFSKDKNILVLKCKKGFVPGYNNTARLVYSITEFRFDMLTNLFLTRKRYDI